VLARGEYDLADRDHTFFVDGFTDHRERLLADLAVWNDVIRIAHVEFVDFFFRHELVDVDAPLALDRYGLKLFRIEFDVLALADLVTFDDVGLLDFITRLRIDSNIERERLFAKERDCCTSGLPNPSRSPFEAGATLKKMRAALAALAQGASFGTTANVWNFYTEGRC
jgi:hypothetical protein